MKLLPAPTHSIDVELRDATEQDPSSSCTATAAADFTPFYRHHFHDCCRWMRAMGAPESELEDLAQEVFLVVRRKLGDEVRDNPAGWLYRIAWGVVSDHRRRRWWKSLFRRAPPEALDALPSTDDGPHETIERRERSHVLQRVLTRMSDVRRTIPRETMPRSRGACGRGKQVSIEAIEHPFPLVNGRSAPR